MIRRSGYGQIATERLQASRSRRSLGVTPAAREAAVRGRIPA